MLNAGYQPIAGSRLVASGTLSAPVTNAAVAYVRGDDGSDVPLEQGEWHEFVSVDLAGIQVKGTPGDVVTFLGGTW